MRRGQHIPPTGAAGKCGFSFAVPPAEGDLVYSEVQVTQLGQEGAGKSRGKIPAANSMPSLSARFGRTGYGPGAAGQTRTQPANKADKTPAAVFRF